MPPKYEKWAGNIHDDPKNLFARKHVVWALDNCPEQYKAALFGKSRYLPMCGRYATKVVAFDGCVVDVLRSRCSCRGCPVCDALRAAAMKRLLKPVIDERFNAGARFSMITLTMPHKRSDDLVQLLKWLTSAVKRFQRSSAFKRHVKGYVRGMEVTWNAKNGFNPHIHYLVECDLWPMEEIKALWTRCVARVGGPVVPPHGTHVMELKDRGQGINEVLGYPFKLHCLVKMPADEVCRLLAATKGLHMAQRCRKWSLQMKVIAHQWEVPTDAADDAEGRLHFSPAELLVQANAGNRIAFDLLVQTVHWLARNWATGGLAARVAWSLRLAAGEHEWELPDLPVQPQAGRWLED